MVKGMANGGPGSEHQRMIFGRENTNYEPPAAAAAGAASLAYRGDSFCCNHQ